jgi:hypothetical protein
MAVVSSSTIVAEFMDYSVVGIVSPFTIVAKLVDAVRPVAPCLSTFVIRHVGVCYASGHHPLMQFVIRLIIVALSSIDIYP